MSKRSVATVILFSIFTCGAYSLYWFYVTTEELNKVGDSESSLVLNFLPAILLSIVTCGIYFIYWQYTFYKKMDEVCKTNNLVICFVCSFFIPIVSMAIAQDTINRIN